MPHTHTYCIPPPPPVVKNKIIIIIIIIKHYTENTCLNIYYHGIFNIKVCIRLHLHMQISCHLTCDMNLHMRIFHLIFEQYCTIYIVPMCHIPNKLSLSFCITSSNIERRLRARSLFVDKLCNFEVAACTQA